MWCLCIGSLLDKHSVITCPLLPLHCCCIRTPMRLEIWAYTLLTSKLQLFHSDSVSCATSCRVFSRLCRYIIRSDPLAHMPEDAQVGQVRSAKNQQDFGTETKEETHLWSADLPPSPHPPLFDALALNAPTQLVLQRPVVRVCVLCLQENNLHFAKGVPVRETDGRERRTPTSCCYMEDAWRVPRHQCRPAAHPPETPPKKPAHLCFVKQPVALCSAEESADQRTEASLMLQRERLESQRWFLLHMLSAVLCLQGMRRAWERVGVKCALSAACQEGLKVVELRPGPHRSTLFSVWSVFRAFTPKFAAHGATFDSQLTSVRRGSPLSSQRLYPFFFSFFLVNICTLLWQFCQPKKLVSESSFFFLL